MPDHTYSNTKLLSASVSLISLVLPFSSLTRVEAQYGQVGLSVLSSFS